MARTEGEGSPEKEPKESDEVLRAKYLDYCSAQIADRLLELPPDEIYLLAEQAKLKRGQDEARFGDLVWMATEGIRERLALPSFEEWVRDYRANPEHYRKYFLVWDTEGLSASEWALARAFLTRPTSPESGGHHPADVPIQKGRSSSGSETAGPLAPPPDGV